MNWTAAQKEAITYENKQNILVAAAAGSGKTAVLVERIIRKILDPTEPVSVDEILVLTFTNAAAREMKNKIAAAIEKKLKEIPDNQHLRSQTTKIAAADVSTIHSFAQKIISNNIHLTNIPAGFSLIGEAENELLLKDALEDCLERYYERFDILPSFKELTLGHGGIKNDDNLRRAITNIYKFSRSLAEPSKWLNNSVKMYFEVYKSGTVSGTEWENIFLSCIKNSTRQLLDYYNTIIEISEKELPEEHTHAVFFEKEAEMFREIMKCGNIEEYIENRQNIKFLTRPRISKKDKEDAYLAEVLKNIADIREEAKKLFKSNKLFSYENIDSLSSSISLLYPRIKTLKNIILMLERRYTRLKLMRSSLDFSDLEHQLIKLIMKSDGSPTEFCKTLSNKYKAIFVDEYQDTNNIQDKLFQLISGGKRNIFMVGDLKQSIYGFRNASPKLFLNKLTEYSGENNNGHLIRLSDNFRSRKNVIDSVNYLFKNVMSKSTAEIDYTEDERLQSGADYPEVKNPSDYKTELIMTDVLDKSSGSDTRETAFQNKHELEARTVAERISKLVTFDKLSVYDSKTGEQRPVEYGDIVILLRSTKNTAPIFEQVLREYNIPVISDSNEGYLDTIEIKTVLSFLEIIDNPLQDIPLIAVMRSPIFGFTADELAEIRTLNRHGNFYYCVKTAAQNDNTKAKKFFDVLNKMRGFSKYMGTDELIYKICYDLDYLAVAGSMSGGNIRQANLKILLQRAGDYERRAFKGLFSFVDYLNKINDSSSGMGQAKSTNGASSAVSITTVHKSKGLEYPVVILAGTTYGRPGGDSVLYDEKYGIGMEYIDVDKRIKHSCLSLDLIKYKKAKESKAEEIRLLYVAMTRAKEKLIISCTNESPGQSKGWKRPILNTRGEIISPYFENSKIFRDWIVLGYLPQKNAEKLREVMESDISELKIDEAQNIQFKYISYTDENINLSQKESIDCEKTINEDISISKPTDEPISKELADELYNNLNYLYPNEELTRIPLKLSVSEIKRSMQDSLTEQDGEYTPILSSIADRTFHSASSGDAAEIGTITHYIMQHINPEFTQSEEQITEQITSLYANNVLTNSQISLIDKDSIIKFYSSEIGCRMRNAYLKGSLKREFKLLFPVSASEIYGDKVSSDSKNAQIIVQGVADCFFIEDNEIVLLDYKTDNCSAIYAPKQAEKYKIQMDYYTKGIESIFGKKIKERIIFFLKPGTAVNI